MSRPSRSNITEDSEGQKSRIDSDDDLARTRKSRKAYEIARQIREMGVLYFPLELVPPGVRYQFFVVTLNNGEPSNATMECEMRGWSKVPASRHPEYSGYNPSKEHNPSYIVRGGQVLMEKDEALVIEDELYYEALALKQMSGAARQLNGIGAGYETSGKVNFKVKDRIFS